MLTRSVFAGALMAGLVASACQAQVPQVVQLPTFSFFTVSTTVSIPDSGGAFMGGVKRSAYGATSRGVPGLSKLPGAGRLFGSRGIGKSHSAGGISATATIIDHSELDAAVLAEAAARRGGGAPTVLTDTDRTALRLSASIGRTDSGALRLGGDAPAVSVAEIRAGNEAAAREHQAAMRDYLEQGQRAAAAGRIGSAKCCYDIVARRASGPLREAAMARLAQIRTMEKQAAARRAAAQKQAPAKSDRP